MKYRDRIVGLIRVWGKRINHHPKNWRVHEAVQDAAVEGALLDIGIAGSGKAVPADPAMLAEARALKTFEERKAWAERFEASDGEVLLLDGHLRDKKIRDQPMPIELLDLNEHEQAEFLATFDPIGDLAGMDREKFVDLANDFNSTNAAVQALVADLAKVASGPLPDGFGLEGDGATGGSEEGDNGPEGGGLRPEPEPPRVSLAERFGVPPFSVLNAREGWWQSRKAAWIALGLRSELGRGGG